ncbi:hypothetical protein CMUS01_05336 [Colletotrichum musicola]|uniref:Uncharacterized protein n=1 Tax=Colletotrichum musicola TaxID=2175873 RepID=A0A8H6KS03_9PEZI|nr:hypothetical protein CMUS01_05336 [Colletotrichum musicola]
MRWKQNIGIQPSHDRSMRWMRSTAGDLQRRPPLAEWDASRRARTHASGPTGAFPFCGSRCGDEEEGSTMDMERADSSP